MNNINELQEEIKDLVKNINNNHKHPQPEIISYMKLIEEIGEITQVLLSMQIDSRKNKKKELKDVKEDLGDEIADSMISLMSLANDFEIDMTEHIRKKLDKHKERIEQISK